MCKRRDSQILLCKKFLFSRRLFTEDVLTAIPILILAAMLKVLSAINIIRLIVMWVLPSLEEGRFMYKFEFFFQLPHFSLFLLKSVFFSRGKLHVSILERTLVCSSTGVSRRNEFGKTLREVIELQREVGHSVHRFPLLWVRSFRPNLLGFANRFSFLIEVL